MQPPQAMGSIGTHRVASTCQEHLDTPITIARVLSGELVHHRDHRRIALHQP